MMEQLITHMEANDCNVPALSNKEAAGEALGYRANVPQRVLPEQRKG